MPEESAPQPLCLVEEAGLDSLLKDKGGGGGRSGIGGGGIRVESALPKLKRAWPPGSDAASLRFRAGAAKDEDCK